MHPLELLAPAGDLLTAKDVLLAGADAVYFGGEAFGALSVHPEVRYRHGIVAGDPGCAGIVVDPYRLAAASADGCPVVGACGIRDRDVLETERLRFRPHVAAAEKTRE